MKSVAGDRIYPGAITQQEVADSVGVKRQTVSDSFTEFGNIASLGKTQQNAANHAEQARQIQADPDAVLRDERGNPKPVGRAGNPDKNKVGNANIINRTNQNNTYLTKRLKRDRPDLLHTGKLNFLTNLLSDH